MTNEELLAAITEQVTTRLDTLHGEIVGLRSEMNERMSSMEGRLSSVDERLDSMENRMESVEERLDSLEENAEVTREGINTLLEWTEDAGKIIRLPLAK